MDHHSGLKHTCPHINAQRDNTLTNEYTAVQHPGSSVNSNNKLQTIERHENMTNKTSVLEGR